MSDEKREQQMMDAADRYADEVCDESCTGAQVAETINDFCAGWRAADSHPNWIPVEEEPYPPKKNKWDKKSEEVLIYGLWMGYPVRLFGTYHYDINEWSANGLISNITHWMPIVPPRKEE